MAKFVPIGDGEYLNIDALAGFKVRGETTQLYFLNQPMHVTPRVINCDLNEIIEDRGDLHKEE